MFKGIIFAIIFIAMAVFGIHKGYHNTIADFGNEAKPFADLAVEKVEKGIEKSKEGAEKTKEVTNKVATEVKERTN